ncbi:hypothetical protein OX89_00420 [Diaphorobacter sp. J5-51]|nr:hypothetical protein OX89_00420 [Diaphorobacter sp. J5-51]
MDEVAICDPIDRHRQNGSFLAIFQYGGRERSIELPSDQKTRFAGFAVRTRQRGPEGQSLASASI